MEKKNPNSNITVNVQKSTAQVQRFQLLAALQATGFPLVEFKELLSSWQNFTELRLPKILFSFLTTFFTLLFGSLTLPLYGILVTSVLHLFVRQRVSRRRKEDAYLSSYQNLGKFSITYFWLIIGNLLSFFVTLNFLPEQSFLAFYQSWLLWSELKGIVNSAKALDWPVPPILEHTLSGKKDLPF